MQTGYQAIEKKAANMAIFLYSISDGTSADREPVNEEAIQNGRTIFGLNLKYSTLNGHLPLIAIFQ